jgi:DMSO/TMAO reductase YedYZ molybdopterin-dependent catalytic subunit
MRRILFSIGILAMTCATSALLLAAAPAKSAAAAHVQASSQPSPQVSVTTLPQLPTVPPTEPTYAPTSEPAPTMASVVAPPGSVISVTGDVSAPKTFTLKDLEEMRHSSLTQYVVDSDGKRRLHTFTGVPLHDLIAAAGPTDPGGADSSIKAYALVSGVNGDMALVAFPEFESAYNGKTILVAYLRDGGPLPGALIGDLIVPEDKSQGRYIQGVTTITVASP